MEKNNEHKDVFISYSSKDYRKDGSKEIMSNNVISKVLKSLDDEGITYWFSDRTLIPGDKNGYIEALANGLFNCSCLIFISSTASNASRWTLKELRTAHEESHIPIIPLDIDGSEYNTTIQFYIGDIQKINYFQDPQQALTKLQDSVLNIIQRPRLNKEYEYRITSNEDAVLFVNDKEWSTTISKGIQTTIKLKNGSYKICLRSIKYPTDYAEKQIIINYADASDFYRLGLQRILLYVSKWFLISTLIIGVLYGGFVLIKKNKQQRQIEIINLYTSYIHQADSLCEQIHELASQESAILLDTRAHILSTISDINICVNQMDSVEHLFDTLPQVCIYNTKPRSQYYTSLIYTAKSAITATLQAAMQDDRTPKLIQDSACALINRLNTNTKQ